MGAAALERREHRLLVVGELVEVGHGERGRRAVGQMQADPRVVPGQPAVAGPQDLAAGHEVVEQVGGRLLDPCGEHERLEGAGREGHPAELLDGPHHALAPAHPSAHALPRGEEASVLARLDGFDLVAQGGQ